MGSDAQSRLTILLVEDEWLVRTTLADYLRAADCDVVEAANGESAVEILQKRNGIDVVFTDIRLGGPLNGWDVGEASRATHPDIPVIYASGNSISPSRQVAGSVFLNKPYDPATVLGECERLFRERR